MRRIRSCREKECHCKLRKVPPNDQTMSALWLQEAVKVVFGHFRPGTHPTPYTMGTGSFPEVKRRGVALTTHAIQRRG